MQEWINSLIWAALGPIRDLAVAIAARISSIWATVTNVFALIRGGYRWWAGIARPWADATVAAAVEGLFFSAFLVRVGIPKLIGHAAGQLQLWVQLRIDGAVVWLVAIIGDVRDWTVAQVLDLLAALGALRAWAVAHILAAELLLRRLVDHTFGVLGSPQRLVRWILAALIESLVVWFLDNVDTLADQAMRRRRRLEVQALTVTERILDRVL